MANKYMNQHIYIVQRTVPANCAVLISTDKTLTDQCKFAALSLQ